MWRCASLILITLVALLHAAGAWANPVPDYFSEGFLGIYWFLRTLPVNYAVDLIALAAALWISGQGDCIPWRMLHVYNIPVVAAGYAADLVAKGLTGASLYRFRPGDHVANAFLIDPTAYSYIPSLWEKAQFMALAGVLIFGLNLLILYAILRLNDADSYRRLPAAAALMAVATSPYTSLPGQLALAALVPSLLTGIGFALYLAARRLRRPPSQTRRTPILKPHPPVARVVPRNPGTGT
ncbi:MAG: hypothetical protein HY321_20820 [Armatimonadetes bacterium]|nr:hypothetical protein [Armatimonadota bacterium]